RIPGRVRLRDCVAGELDSETIVVALRARKIQLALTAMERGAARFEMRLHPVIGLDVNRQTARLARDIGAQREQFPTLERQRRRLLALDTAFIDALLEIQQASFRVDCRIARRNALHAARSVAMAVSAGSLAVLAVPQRFALEHPERAGINRVVVLHGARLAAHELVAGLALGQRNLACESRGDQNSRGQKNYTALQT